MDDIFGIIKTEPEEVSSISLRGNTATPSFVAPAEKIVDGTEHILRFDVNVSLTVDSERPRKKQRVIMEVVVPTVNQLRKKGIKDTPEMKLKKLFKPKGKKNVSLSDEVLLRRLEPIGLDPVKIDLSRSELNQMVTRLFMSAVYGGSMQATFPKVSKRKSDQHGKDDFMYLHLDYHPFAPQTPGGCGLWFSTEEEDPENGFEGVKRVFTRDWKSAIWQYMGQYKVKPAQSLTLDEWLDQPDKVRKTWAREICTKPWGGDVRARIQVRKAIREPTEVDVLEAFDTGKERLGVWTMKCIGYDRDFQLELYQKFPQWTPPPPETKKVKKEQRKKGSPKKRIKKESTTPSPSKGKKRKRVESESEREYASELDVHVKDMDEDDSDEGSWAQPIYVE